jgi:hypothetical protein
VEIERLIVVGVMPACAAVAAHRTIPVSHRSATEGLTLILSPRFNCIARLRHLSYDLQTLYWVWAIAGGSVQAAEVCS